MRAAVMTMYMPNQPDPMVVPGPYSLGEMKDGCIPITSTPEEFPESVLKGTICGDVITAESAGYSLVLHKRR